MKQFLTIFFLFVMFTGYSQVKKGTIKDANGNPIENAYIINTVSQSPCSH